MAKSKRSPARVKAALLRKQAIELRISGHTYAQIAEQISRSKERAYQLIQEAMAENLRDVRELAKEELGNQLTITAELLKVDLPRALAGDPDAKLTVLKILERRAKLVGADFTMQPLVDTATDGVQYVVMAPAMATNAEEWYKVYGQLANQQSSPAPEKH